MEQHLGLFSEPASHTPSRQKQQPAYNQVHQEPDFLVKDSHLDFVAIPHR